MKKYGLNELKFVFYITDEWDDGIKTMESEPMTLGELIDGEQVDFTDGGYVNWDDLDWSTVKVEVRVIEPKRKGNWESKMIRIAERADENIPKGFDNEGNYKGY